MAIGNIWIIGKNIYNECINIDFVCAAFSQKKKGEVEGKALTKKKKN